MTYCLAATLSDGLVFVSDSRTNAGIDQLGTYSKMHPFTDIEGRFFTLLSAGNLATTQAVIARLRRDIRDKAKQNFANVKRIREAADYVGEISRSVQARYKKQDRTPGFSPDADFLLGGKIGDEAHGLFHIYPQGNYVAPTELAPFLQIGEQKYGKPILDRIIEPSSPLETAALCGLLSMDSTMRSNASVGPPIEVMIFNAKAPASHTHLVYREDDPYLRSIREAWAESLRSAFDQMPPLRLPPEKLRLVDPKQS